MKRNKQHVLIFTNHNLQTWHFEPAEESHRFLRSLRVTDGGKKSINISYNFDLRSHVISKWGNDNKEIAGRWHSMTAYVQKIMSPVCYKFRIQRHCLVKHFAFLKNFCYQNLNFALWVTYRFFASCWLAHNQLKWNVLSFSSILIAQLCLSWPSYSSRTVNP